MITLLKTARTTLGDYNPDDDLDHVGYAAIAGELRRNEIDQEWADKKLALTSSEMAGLKG